MMRCFAMMMRYDCVMMRVCYDGVAVVMMIGGAVLLMMEMAVMLECAVKYGSAVIVTGVPCRVTKRLQW